MLNLMTTYSIVAQPKTADMFNHYVRYCALGASARDVVGLSRALTPLTLQVTTRAPTELRAVAPRHIVCVRCVYPCLLPPVNFSPRVASLRK